MRDEHIALAVTRGLERVDIDAAAVAEWQEQRLRTASDEDIPTAAAVEQRVLLTFDVRRLRPLTRHWRSHGRHHAGIIFVDDRTFRQNDIGGLIRALTRIVSRHADENWQVRELYLPRD